MSIATSEVGSVKHPSDERKQIKVWDLVKTLAQYGLMLDFLLEFLISFILESQNNALFFIETSHVKEEFWTSGIMH